MSPYLVAAYVIIWAGIMIYMFSLGARQRALFRRVERLSALVEGQDADRS